MSEEMHSQRRSQAVLVQGGELDPSQATFYLGVFNKDGTPFIPGGGAGEWQWVADQDLVNGWTSVQGANQMRFRKRQNGIVEMRGYVIPGTSGLVFYLPEDCRSKDTGAGPAYYPLCGGEGDKFLRGSVGADGAISVQGDVLGIEWVSLAPIRFPTD